MELIWHRTPQSQVHFRAVKGFRNKKRANRDYAADALNRVEKKSNWSGAANHVSSVNSCDPSPNRIWITACFILGWWVREHLPILTQPRAEREAGAYKSARFLDDRAKSGISSLISHSPLCPCRLREPQREGVLSWKKNGPLIWSPSAFWTPTSSLKPQSQCLYEEIEPTRTCFAKCYESLWM